MDDLHAQIVSLQRSLTDLELSTSTKLARINTEHVKELEDLQAVHIIRLERLQNERDVLQVKVYSLEDQVEALEVQLNSVKAAAGIAGDLATSLEELRRDSKCDFEGLEKKAELEREQRVDEIRRREEVERELGQRLLNLQGENETLHKVIEGLRTENEMLRHASAQQRRRAHRQGDSLSELIETDLTMMQIGL
ncbi:hypothetical protein HDU79_003403 [Rhizoclosmatium sp. JEL0117]|nr:hypothetical protein HDU79_003403 [Rhizoclosmatium sp. JEL0117]